MRIYLFHGEIVHVPMSGTKNDITNCFKSIPSGSMGQQLA